MNTTNQSVRHDFVMLVEAIDSNPNGDPDLDNAPRTDDETGHGLITDVCIKRRVRDYVAEIALDESDNDRASRLGIYVQSGTALNAHHEAAYEAVGAKPPKKPGAENLEAQAWLCDRFYDVRAFGAVMSTGTANCGQVRGPIQIGYGRSIDPIQVTRSTITRVAVTRTDDLAKKASGEKGGKDREMGAKHTTPYGLYMVKGSYSAPLADRSGSRKGTGFDSDDLALFWEALVGMWDNSISAARSQVHTRALHVFSHDTPRGNAPLWVTHELVQVTRNPDVDTPRRFADYTVTVNDAPDGVTHTALLG